MEKYINEIIELLNSAKRRVLISINTAMVYTYYEIGRLIVNQEQKGKNRAEYGKTVLKNLSNALSKEFGKGYSISNLRYIRQFFITYSSDKIRQTLFGEFEKHAKTKDGRSFFLGWAHYVRLIQISDINERHFYEIEAYQNKWSFRELNRQVNSSLYERLILSKNKNEILKLSQVGQIVNGPSDIIKDPYILEFLNLKESISYSEKDLETTIINKLQDFLLELGKGFTFVQRQMRLSFNEQHYYADLVFYNRLLRCFVVIDLKIGKIQHQDIGQMQMYVNYFDRYVKLPEENKTIGILLCKEKDDSLVQLTLPEDNEQIFASRYETILPSKEELIKLIEEE